MHSLEVAALHLILKVVQWHNCKFMNIILKVKSQPCLHSVSAETGARLDVPISAFS